MGYSSCFSLEKELFEIEDSDKVYAFLIQNEGVHDLKELALEHSRNNQPETAADYILEYVSATADLSFINDHLFENIKDSEAYMNIKDKYSTNFSFFSILYVFAGFLGFFIFLVLSFKKDVDRTSTLLIGLFILFHSLFILHLSLYVTNYQYHVPHALFISTTFSFLYGPLLYFYFKRTIFNYNFRWVDGLHLIPSVLLLFYILPYYLLPGLDKFQIIFNQDNFLLPGANFIIVVKIISLSIYAFLIFRMYREFTVGNDSRRKNKVLWQRNIITIFITYILAYSLYAGTITEIIAFPLLMHLQILVMVGLVFYVAYISYVQPEVFKGQILLVDPTSLFKYRKSRLTPSYSTELKDKLLHLLEDEKVYKLNTINLELLSEKLGTNRHNTSQVINEHFNMNFFELINTYRINEALEILKSDANNSLNIIEVAYEVGFNNKVTFNKSFKKLLSQTPTQYLDQLKTI